MKSLDRVLRVEKMVEGISGANRPIRFYDDAAFEFAADGRWIFIGGADDYAGTDLARD